MSEAEDAQKPIVVSCVNLKGGVGKTAIAVNFAAYCAREGKRTLLVDLDPQTNASFWCMDVSQWQEHAKKNGTVADILGHRNHVSADGSKKDINKIIKKDVLEKGLDIIPSHLDLFTIDLDMAAVVARERKLKKALEEVHKDYDIIVCDCPPNLTIPTQNAIAASTHFVIPVSPDFLSSLGVALLIKRVEEFSEDLDNPIKNAGIIMSRVGRQSIFREQTIQSLRERFPDMVFAAEIRERSDVAEAVSQNRSVFQTSNRDAINEFSNFGAELAQELGLV